MLFFSQGTFAQGGHELRTLVMSNPAADTAVVNACAGLAGTFRNVSTDSMLYFADKGEQLAAKLHFEAGGFRCRLQKGIAYVNRRHVDTAEGYINECLGYFRKNGDSLNELEALHWKGLVYYFQSHLDSALSFFKASKQLARSLHADSLEARASFYIANMDNEKGDFSPALEEYLNALRIYDKSGDRGRISTCLANIATLYAQLDQRQKAYEYIDSALAHPPDMKEKEVALSALSNVGIALGLVGDSKRALGVYRNGKRLADSVGSIYWGAVFLANMAEIYAETGMATEAINTYGELLEQNRELNDLNFVMSAHSGMGRLLFAQGKRKEGIRHMEQAYELMKGVGMKRYAMDAAHDLATAYATTGDYKKALAYTEAWYNYKDSIHSEHAERRLQQLQYEYELAKKQAEIEQLDKKRQVQKVVAARQRVVSWSLGGGVLLLAVIALLAFRNHRQERKVRQELAIRNDEIAEQASALKRLNAFKDKAFSVLSHDLRAPINSITAAVHMLNDETMTREEYDDLKPEIDRQLASLNLLMDNVLLWARGYIGQGQLVTAAVTDMGEILSENIKLLQDAASRKHITLANAAEAGIEAWCDRGQMDIVIRNLLMNAIKFTAEGGVVTVAGENAADGWAVVWVEDTGIGMTPEQLAGLFVSDENRSTAGTRGERGIGLGLLLCRDFVQANKGKLEVTSEPGKGTRFTVRLPRQKMG